MTKVEFLQQLSNHLSGFSPAERDEIIQDFEEHFSAGIELGKSEEQICEELGTPYSCAMQYVNSQQTASSSASASVKEQPTPNRAVYRAPSQAYQKPNFDRRNKTLWTLMFIFLVLCALGVYPASVLLMLTPIVLILASVVAASDALMVGMFVSMGVMLAAAGLLMFAIMTWLLKLCYRKAGI